jgi:hypothetical protein
MDGLKLFLEDGTVEMDSNVVKRSIRPIALERVALNRFQSWLWLAAHNATTVMHVAKRM